MQCHLGIISRWKESHERLAQVLLVTLPNNASWMFHEIARLLSMMASLLAKCQCKISHRLKNKTCSVLSMQILVKNGSGCINLTGV